MIVRRRGMPLIRGALIGGVAYGVGRRTATSAQRAPATDVTTRLTQLSELLQQGALTQEEFVQAKAKVLAP
jgi:hypothetical protein